ncbi:prolyl oligopeptidase family serine peptidase [Maribellus comscasis]|uniref:Prolyl oligopeptidase family serine peptidase n=1 Tax=Maribellus comscasis TaxID=2681766 RepID=A0A6I6JSD0_9BACT|nr:alpha/beta hydrolase [Maribellus comscasis]QGY42773.1 prolyl oligopeptidase family serine peptidase [Maribellus comscasis]
MKRLLFLILFVQLVCSKGFSQHVIPLYDGQIPGEIQAENTEVNKNGIFSNISKPELTIYIPEKSDPGKTAIVICPGGGYGVVCASYEGHKIARAMNEKGVAAFVLKYRLPSDRTCSDKAIAPLQDAQRAIKIVRDNAGKWGVNPNKIGIIGFSAGGHLASTAGTHFSKSYIQNNESTSLRPDFMMLIYPVISMQPELTHVGSRKNLLGENPSPELLDLFSNEKQVTENTPSAFLMHAMDDDVVPVENSIRFYEAMKEKNVPADMHLFSTGKHGFPLEPAKSNWLDYAFQWMREQQLIGDR